MFTISWNFVMHIQYLYIYMYDTVFWTLIPHVSSTEDQSSDGDTTQPQRLKEARPVEEGNEISGGRANV